MSAMGLLSDIESWTDSSTQAGACPEAGKVDDEKRRHASLHQVAPCGALHSIRWSNVMLPESDTSGTPIPAIKRVAAALPRANTRSSQLDRFI